MKDQASVLEAPHRSEFMAVELPTSPRWEKGGEFMRVIVQLGNPDALRGTVANTTAERSGRVKVPAVVASRGPRMFRAFARAVRGALAQRNPARFGDFVKPGASFDLEDAGAGEVWA